MAEGGSVLSKISLKDSAVFIAEMTPIIGDAMAAKDIWDEIQREDTNWGYVGALGGAAIVGLIPGIGDLAAKAIKVGAKKGLSLAKRIDLDTSSMGSGLGNVKFKPKVKVKEPFDLKALATASKQNDASREILVEMPIDDFLKAAKKEISPEKLAGTRELVKSGTPFNSIPYLSFKNIGDGTGEVVGHEGRHRAIALKEAGETTIPVRLMSQGSETGSSIRWGKQNDPKDMDYVEVLPTKLIEEEGKAIVNMPALAANIRKLKQFAEGGSVNTMNNQMRMFEEGGIADDGMDTDPVSGNEVPSGSLASEVRDDIPAQLSEGEYVVPADVVRFFGVRVFEEMRMEAKMGLQKMEQDGRIGGEPTMAQSAPPSNDSSITDEDLEQIEKMMTTGVADGGLMDKVAFIAANDPVINKSFNQGGAVVSFAVGGATQSAYNDPTKVDAVIGKFMQLVQSKPEIMDELAKRGIRVTRTGAEQKPQAMQQDNSASRTTEPVMAGKPAPAPVPVQAAEGILASPKSESYITAPTMPLPPGFMEGYSVPGSSLTFQGPGVAKSTAVPTAPSVPTAITPAAASVPTCPPGQEYDKAKGMCVPRQDYDGSKKDETTPTPQENWGEDIDWTNPEAMTEYAKGILDPMDAGLAKAIQVGGVLVGGPLGFLAAGAPVVKAINDLSNARASVLIARAKGDDATADLIDAQIAEYVKAAPSLATSKFGSWMSSGTGRADQLARRLGFKDLEDATERQDLFNAKLQSEKITKNPDGSKRRYLKPSAQKARRQKEDAAMAAKTATEQKAAASYRANDKESSNVSLGQGTSAAVKASRDRASASRIATAKASKMKGGVNKENVEKAGGTYATGGRAKGGLMKRNRIK